jgi:hypothetical protein
MTKYTPGDTWEEHYRGFELRINVKEEVWWQVYNGTDRLHLEPKPTGIVEQLLELKPLGGRIRVTEDGAVITRKEKEDVDTSGRGTDLEDYTPVFVGELELEGSLVPVDAPEYEVPLRPDSLSTGDLWPSVYDGARYSYGSDGRAWWNNPITRNQHPVTGGLPDHVEQALKRVKPEGGSFRVTPAGDVITLVRAPATQTVKEQFGDLPRVVRNIIKLRRDRADLQMLPIFVERVDERPFEVEEPRSLTDSLSAEEQEALQGWATSLGHRACRRLARGRASRTTMETKTRPSRSTTRSRG